MAFVFKQFPGRFAKLTLNIIKPRKYTKQPYIIALLTSIAWNIKNYKSSLGLDNQESINYEIEEIMEYEFTLRNHHTENNNFGIIEFSFRNRNVDGFYEKPRREHLEHVYNVLSDNLPKFFHQSMDYKIYHPEIIFENNIKRIRTIGVYSYKKQAAVLQAIGHFKYAYISFEVLKITKNPEDSSVKVRWRIKGVPRMRAMFAFWKDKDWKLREVIKKADSWYDGYSTFYINGKGLVIKHVADKMMPDSYREENIIQTSPLEAVLNIEKIDKQYFGIMLPH